MKHEVKVTYDTETGEVKSEGPFEDAIMFLGMLEMGKLIFFVNYNKKVAGADKAIVVPNLPFGRPPS